MEKAEKTAWVKFGLKDFVSIILTAAVSIPSTYWVFKNNEATITVKQLEVLYEQLQAERLIRKEMEQKIADLTSEVLSFRVQLATKYNSTASFRRSLDRMPFPVFIKLESIEDGAVVLRNWHINRDYSHRFNVTAEHYRGKTDFELWADQVVAKEFYDFDITILKYKNHKCEFEVYPRNSLLAVSEDNPLYVGYVCKWYDRVEGQRAVVGAIISEELYKGGEQ